MFPGDWQGGTAAGARVQGMVLEPCRVGVSVAMERGAGTFNLDVSDLRLNLSPDILELASSLQTSVLEPLVQPAHDQYPSFYYSGDYWSVTAGSASPPFGMPEHKIAQDCTVIL